MLDSDNSLVYQHTQAVDDFAPFGSGILTKLVDGDDISHNHLGTKGVDIKVQTLRIWKSPMDVALITTSVSAGIWCRFPWGKVCVAWEFVLKKFG